MPIYEYACQACGHHFEKLQKFSDAQLCECPACHKPKLEQLISATGFQLKGDGWFKPAAKPAESTVSQAEPKASGCGSCSKNSPHSH